MTNNQKPPKIFSGWWIVFACSIVGFLGVGVASSGLSVLFKPIAEELGLSRAAASIASGIQSIGQGISGLGAGRATDRYGPRRIIIVGVVLMMIGLVAMHFVNSLWSFLLAWGLLVGTGFSFGCTFVTDTAIVKWFSRKSGIAINLKFAVQSLSSLALLPIMALLTTSQGWRFTCVAAAAAIGAISLPLTWFLVKPHPPEHYGLRPDGDKESEPDNTSNGQNIRADDQEEDCFTLKQAIKTRSYWLLTVMSYLSAAAAPILSVHCIPFLTDRGIDSVKAAGMMAIILTSGVPARLITGFILDRVKTVNLRFMIMTGYLLQSLGVVIFLISGSVFSIYLWFFFCGFGNGVTQGTIIPSYARFFGRRSFGAIMGSTMFTNMPIAIVAPIYIGWIYDRTGSYMIAVTGLAVCCALAGIVATFTKPPKRRVESGRA